MTLADVLAATTTPPPDPTTTYVILGAAALFLVYGMQRMSKRKRSSPPENTFFTRNSLAQERRAQQDMENVLVELSKMSRELSAQLDTRAAKLDALIGDADERIARLETLLRQAPARPEFARAELGRSDFAPGAAESLMRLVNSPASDGGDKYASPAAIGRPADDMAPSPSLDAEHAEIYRLADEGRNVSQIAGELSRPSGEVELILALRPRN